MVLEQSRDKWTCHCKEIPTAYLARIVSEAVVPYQPEIVRELHLGLVLFLLDLLEHCLQIHRGLDAFERVVGQITTHRSAQNTYIHSSQDSQPSRLV